MPARVKDIRVLLAELQRITSHLVWLGTHALEIGAVSVMMYCFRERELLLNINELIAGFRMFPSYIRVGGLREDLPPGFHEAVTAFLDRFPAKIDRVRRPADQEPDLAEAHARRRRDLGGGHDGLRARRTDRARVGVTVRRAQDLPVSRLRDLRFQRADRHARRRLRPLSRAHGGDAPERKIAKQALARITPRGDLRHPGLPHRPAAEGQGLHARWKR